MMIFSASVYCTDCDIDFDVDAEVVGGYAEITCPECSYTWSHDVNG